MKRIHLVPGHDLPLIGVTTSEMRRAETVQLTPQGEPARHEMALGLTYLRAIEWAGGIPIVIPPLHIQAITPLLDQISGICLSGGPDLDPQSYGAREHPELGPTEPDLDRFELAVARRADARGMPLLAICRGAQALNVVRGGTLVQHLPDRAHGIEHRQDAPGEEPTHSVQIDADSRLAELLGTTSLEVNSFHHQGIDEVGKGLRAVAHSSDGEIEGVESPDRPFCVGVQWHAELLVERPTETALFEAFVAACRQATAAAAAREVA
jgi:putative glutamine amidotransferase